jgi:peptide/nickel transport system permease protein
MAELATADERSPVSGLQQPDWLVHERSGWDRLKRSLRPAKLAIVGLCVLAVVIVVAIFAPVLAPHDPNDILLDAKLTPPVWQSGGTWEYPLGTDKLGRDVLSRIMYGARISLVVGFGAVFFGGLIGVTLGLISGYYGGWVDDAITLLTEIQMAFPTILLALAIMAVLGPGLRNVIIVLSFAGWVAYDRVVRGQALAVREQLYVEAARVIGVRDWKILLRHILPNVAASVVIIGSFGVASAIISEAFLSFLGLGIGPETPTWGGMLADGRDLIREAWWLATLPGLAIMLTVLCINAVGDWLRDFLDPRLRI